MAAESLIKSMDDIRTEVADFLYGVRDFDSLDDNEQARITSAMKTGLHQFYFPPPRMNTSASHAWSFLRPWTTITTVTGTYDYDLPANFAFLEGDAVFSLQDVYPPVRQVSVEKLNVMRSQADLNIYPQAFAIQTVVSDGTAPPGFRILFYPTPDSEYTLHYQYSLLPDALSADAPYPLGGTQHAETVLESCLAAAEGRFDDEAQGSHYNLFLMRLDTSISIDRRVSMPQFLGRNGDPSVQRGNSYRRATTLLNQQNQDYIT